MTMQKQKELAVSAALMLDLQRVLNKINIAKKKGKNQLYIIQDVDADAIVALRDMGYLALQSYSNGYVFTIVGWKQYG